MTATHRRRIRRYRTLGPVADQLLDGLLLRVLHHIDGHPEVHGGLLTEPGRASVATVREVHPADLAWIEQRRAAA